MAVKKNDTPLMVQYWAIKEQHKDMFLFFRMGDFYELFFDDAVKGSKILNISLTCRDKAKTIPLAGVPHRSIDQYLSKMLAAGYKSAVCDQVEDPKQAKGIVKRRVTRLVTPGTIMEDSLLANNDHNFTVSIFTSRSNLTAVAYIDISTGDFRVIEFKDDSAYSLLKNHITRIDPKEYIISEDMRSKKSFFKETGIPEDQVTFKAQYHFNYEHCVKTITKHFNTAGLEGFNLKGKREAVSACGALLEYIAETQLRKLDNIHSIKLEDTSGFMVLDSSTQKNLELTRTIQHQRREGSLLDTIDMTKTPIGARLLKEWLLQPLTCVDTLNKRLDGVSELADNDKSRRILRSLLQHITDMERANSRITQNILTPRDLIALKNSIGMLPQVMEVLNDSTSPILKEMLKMWDNLEDIGKLIASAISDAPPATIRDAGVIKDGYNDEVDEFRSILANSRTIIVEIEAKERKRTGIDNLKIKFNSVFGYYIEISKIKAINLPDDYIRKQTLANAERFINQELKETEAKILNAQEHLSNLEKKLYENIRLQVASQAYRIKATSLLVGIIDILASSAELAKTKNYKRPALFNSRELFILNGRHPVIDAKDSNFIPNNLRMDEFDNRFLIITGPNMAGKSTFMRQAALIVIMAQTGLFVPADEARIGMVDRVFTRVGASDNLLEGQSTFMVEMTETANILNNATEKSLIILDEIGRGTSTYDGLSIAKSVAEHIQDKEILGARTLFATHYHEMTSLAYKYEGVKNYSIAIQESGHKLIFLRKVVEGPADKSYGVHVARLAGLPKPVIDRAFLILSKLEETPMNALKRLKSLPKITPPTLFPNAKVKEKNCNKEFKELTKELTDIDLSATTPIDALNKLYDLQNKWKNKSDQEPVGLNPS